MPRRVALLRGINVGGNNMISMVALRACFEEAGFDDVATYIQSGNVGVPTDAGLLLTEWHFVDTLQRAPADNR